MAHRQETLTVFADSTGMFLAARDGDDPFRDTWLLTTRDDGTIDVRGPTAFGKFLKFVPSDWEPAIAPLPEPVQFAIDHLDSSA